jgi:pSer/pThr/pTyr-binding forkhead associated (FHA) protein
MIRMLGGVAEPAPHPGPAAPPPSAFAPPPPAAPLDPAAPPTGGQPYPGAPPFAGDPGQAAPPPPGVYYPPLPVPERWPEPPTPPHDPSAMPAGHAPGSEWPTRPSGPPEEFSPGAVDNDGKSRFMGGVDSAKVKIPKSTYTLQILDTSGPWRDWGPIHASGMNVGRAQNSADFPGLNTMAIKHMRFSYDNGGLVVEDLGSLNGICLKITQPVELIDGMRFRVGNQTIEFHHTDPFEPVPPRTAEDGEEYCSRDLEPLAYLDMIRPNGKPGLRFPITKLDTTVIGREGPNAHIALTSDSSVSASHAQIRREDGKFFLDDLKSRNGTFVHILGSHPVQSGDVILAGRVLFRVVDHAAES